MKKKTIIITLILALAVVFISGCITDDVTDLARMNPIISQFLEEYPNAKIDVTHLSISEFDVNKEDILFYCNQNNAFITKTSIEPAEYYFVGITDEESNKYIFAFINWDDRIIECAVKGDATEEGIQVPPSQVPQVQEETNTAEKEYEEAVCSALPQNAVYGPDGLSLQIPLSLEAELGTIGGAIGFTYSNIYMKTSTAGERTYANGGWMSSGFSNEYLLIIPINARLKDGTTKTGGLKLTFTGTLQPYQMTITQQSTQTTMVDGPGGRPTTPVQYNWYRYITKPSNPTCPYGATCEFESVPALSRTGCIVDFEKPCEQKEGYNLAGQCHYADFIGDVEKVPELVKNLGQCRYCQSGLQGTWGALGICGEGFNCISTGGGVVGTYFVSCSECKTTPPSSSYNGGSYAWCNYYYNACVQSGCGKILDNCR